MSENKKKPILLYITSGHWQDVGGGQHDPGAVSGKFVEAKIAQAGCMHLYQYLLDNRGILNFRVAYPERDGNGMHLYEHLAEIKEYRKRYRVVVFDWHLNAGGGKGCECHINFGNKYSYELAKMILEEQKEIGRPWHSYNGTIEAAIHKRKDFIILQGGCPSILFEMGYVDNKVDRKDFDTDREVKQIAEAVGKSMIRYCRKYD